MKRRNLQRVKKVCFFKKSACSQSLSPLGHSDGFASCKARCVLISASLPITPSPRGEGLCMLGWLCICAIVVVCCRCILHRLCSTTCVRPCAELWAYTPGIRAGAECGAAALTKQGCLQSVAHSRCTMQRHQRLTTRIGATPKARMLWLLAKSFARCKTNRASNAKHPF